MHPSQPFAHCPFVQRHIHAFTEAGWLLMGLLAAVVWLSLLVLTGFSPLAVSLGLLLVLVLTASH